MTSYYSVLFRVWQEQSILVQFIYICFRIFFNVKFVQKDETDLLKAVTQTS